MIVRTNDSNQNKVPDLDCCVCIRRDKCSKWAENSFCSKFKSRNYDPGRREPLKIWEEERKKRREAVQKNMKDK